MACVIPLSITNVYTGWIALKSQRYSSALYETWDLISTNGASATPILIPSSLFANSGSAARIMIGAINVGLNLAYLFKGPETGTGVPNPPDVPVFGESVPVTANVIEAPVAPATRTGQYMFGAYWFGPGDAVTTFNQLPHLRLWPNADVILTPYMQGRP